MDKFVVSYAPFVRSSNDVNKMFLYTSISLLIPAVFGCLFFGPSTVFLLLVSVVTCFLSESFFNLFAIHKFRVFDLSFLVTGLVLALSMPYKMPLYIVAIAAFFAVFVVKMVFGGLGKNKFNPAPVGRLFAGILASGMGDLLYNIVYNGEVYTSLAFGGQNSILNLLTGKAVGGLGTTCVICIAISYVVLVYMSVIDWKIPVLCVLSYFVAGVLFVGTESTFLNICSGSFVFVSVFMMSEPNTSPNTLLGKIVYSVMFGVLSAITWNIGLMGEETIFAVALFVNMFVPFMDKYFVIKQKPLGGYRYAH